MPAPRGNTNALKHGLYARHLTVDEASMLDKVKGDLTHEITILRVYVDRLSTQLEGKTDYSESDRAKINLINSLSTTIGNLTMHIIFMTGQGRNVKEATEEVVLSRSFHWEKA